MDTALDVVCGYEGSNPQDERHIQWLDEGAVQIAPQSEDGDSNYKFAFDVTVRNASDRPRPLALEVDWQELPEVGTQYMPDRESTFVYNGGGWREVQGQLDGDKVRFALRIPPGETRVCLHPPFGTCALEAFFEDVAELGDTQRVVFGQTAEGRPIEAAVIPSLKKQELCLLAVGRLHPYETAGSYVVWGLLDLLAGGRGRALREACSVILVPVANPDGVAHGLCKRTAQDGVDLSAEGYGSSDPTACALQGLIAGVACAARRSVLWDAHGWMNQEEGIWVYRAGLMRQVLAQVDGELFPQGWRSSVRSLAAAHSGPGDLRRYAASPLGMDVMVTSSPWFGRSIATMREIGGEVGRAILHVLR